MIANLAQQLIQQLREKGWKIRCVESCTAGGLTAAIGSINGASDVLDRSWVTYSNQAKHEEVGVPLELIDSNGAVSEAVVIAMAKGAVSGCDNSTVAISVSGIAGPGGGTTDKPVGTVWIGISVPQKKTFAKRCIFDGTREHIQQCAVKTALKEVLHRL